MRIATPKETKHLYEEAFHTFQIPYSVEFYEYDNKKFVMFEFDEDGIEPNKNVQSIMHYFMYKVFYQKQEIAELHEKLINNTYEKIKKSIL